MCATIMKLTFEVCKYPAAHYYLQVSIAVPLLLLIICIFIHVCMLCVVNLLCSFQHLIPS